MKEKEIEITITNETAIFWTRNARREKKIDRRRSVERRIISWLRNLRVWFGSISKQLLRATVSKAKLAMTIATFTAEPAPEKKKLTLFYCSQFFSRQWQNLCSTFSKISCLITNTQLLHEVDLEGFVVLFYKSFDLS